MIRFIRPEFTRGAVRRALVVAAVTASLSVSSTAMAPIAAAQAAMPKGALPTTAPVVVTLMRDAQSVGDKMVALAKAIPADKYDWRPAPGVRSVREALLHVASDNYLLPAMLGSVPPAETGINNTDMKAVERYEKRPLSQAEVAADVQRSYDFLAASMAKTDVAGATAMATFFGQKAVMQDVWISATTHMHEHLGQLIAYARMNGVTPPWSK